MSLPLLTEEAIKGRAKAIRELIKREFGHDVPHGQCLKIVSQLFGFDNWNTAKAVAAKANANTTIVSDESRIESITAGEMIDLLRKVSPDTRLFDFEDIDLGSDDGITHNGTERIYKPSAELEAIVPVELANLVEGLKTSADMMREILERYSVEDLKQILARREWEIDQHLQDLASEDRKD